MSAQPGSKAEGKRKSKKSGWNWCSRDLSDDENIIIENLNVHCVTIPQSTTDIGASTRNTLLWWGGQRRTVTEPILPQKIEFILPSEIKQITGVDSNLLFLLDDGSLWMQETKDGIITTDLNRVEGFGESPLEMVAGGENHTLAVDKAGLLWSWGSNKWGQLGLGKTPEECQSVSKPQLVLNTAAMVVIQVSVGNEHSVVLTDLGNIYLCGSNEYGQLGVPKELISHSITFFQVVDCVGIPWGCISSGGYHSLALSVDGDVALWGRNGDGQLLLEECPYIDSWITITPNLRDLDTFRYLACGDKHTAFITKEGTTTIVGDNHHGQRDAVWDQGKEIQIAAGRWHTLSLSFEDDGALKLYCMGLIIEPNVETEGEIRPKSTPVTMPSELTIKSIHAAGLFSFVIVSDSQKVNRIDFRESFGGRRQLRELSEGTITPYLEISLPLEASIREAFIELVTERGILNGSFRVKDPSRWEEIVQSNPWIRRHVQAYGNFVDFTAVEETATKVKEIQTKSLKASFAYRMREFVSGNDMPTQHNQLTLYAFVPLLLVMDTAEDWIVLCRTLMPLPPRLWKYVVSLIYNCYSTEQLEEIVKSLRGTLIAILVYQRNKWVDLARVAENQNRNPPRFNLPGVLKGVFCLLGVLFRENRRHERLNPKAFQLNNIELLVDLKEDYIDWFRAEANTNYCFKFDIETPYFLCHFMYLFDGVAKAELLKAEQYIKMVEATILSRMFKPDKQNEFIISVNRDNLLQDAVNQITKYNPIDFHKPLRVHFIGEEAQDAGGVRKEFFLLLVRQIFDYGATRKLLDRNEESGLFWFNEQDETIHSSVGDNQDIPFCWILGVVCGLAIYNSIIVTLPFPTVIYKKLLQEDKTTDSNVVKIELDEEQEKERNAVISVPEESEEPVNAPKKQDPDENERDELLDKPEHTGNSDRVNNDENNNEEDRIKNEESVQMERQKQLDTIEQKLGNKELHDVIITIDVDDITQLSPTVGKSLRSLLDYEGADFEQVFDLNFEIAYQKSDNAVETIELKPNGGNIPVTQDNKKEYVDLYVDNWLNKRVAKSFSEFRKGFLHTFQGSNIIKLFTPEELQETIIGNENYEWDKLEEGSMHRLPYTPDHPAIVMFWDVFHMEFTIPQKIQFLLFLTGSDRIPIAGTGGIKILFQPSEKGPFALPVAHTCFNLLDLPEYTCRETMVEKLLLAIAHSEGFELV